MLHLGIDMGSKTVKLVVLDDAGQLVHDRYERHLSNVPETLSYLLRQMMRRYPDERFSVGVTGSAGMQLSELAGLRFDQEVIAARAAIERFIPQTDVAIEIGGEDSKILYLTGGEELRMNSTCAGGTGGFIDTIAGMLDANAEKLNYYAYGGRHVHPIASRCAVFAQSDVRPLLNEGVSKEDIALSALDAVVTQCITGLACGRPIGGNVAFLGGPLHFLSALRERFRVRLGLEEGAVVVPANGHLFVAQGAALLGWNEPPITLAELTAKVEAVSWDDLLAIERLEPLFASKEEHRAFRARHDAVSAPRGDITSYEGPLYLGVDSGSEAIKYALIGEDGQLFLTYYERSAGQVVEAAREMLVKLWKRLPRRHDGTHGAYMAHAAVTGYGEAYLKRAFAFDSGEVETVAHVRAAQELVPDASFLLDIGGQDMKCVYLRNGEVDNVVLNEACSSGCGALLSGMAWSMNVRLDRFVEQSLFAEAPVDLGTRCTVFMTSRVRHAQKEGASVGDLAAGLAYSVVRNALYKVIRVRDVSELGESVVVQGGTFANDAVLRAFEKLLGREVVRPEIAPYMGAYGAALIARDRARVGERSTLLPLDRVRQLQVSQRTEPCGKCPNGCMLVRTSFSDAGQMRTFTVGNRCERGEAPGEVAEGAVGGATRGVDLFDARYKRLFSYSPRALKDAPFGSIGLVRALDMFELYPFWFTFFDRLGFRVELSRQVRSSLRGAALETIPAESLCYPAKLAHGGLVDLIERGVKRVFLPYVARLSERGKSCPVTAGYPLVLEANVDLLRDEGVCAIDPAIPQLFERGGIAPGVAGELASALEKAGVAVDKACVRCALEEACAEQRRFRDDMAALGFEALASLRAAGGRGIVCAARPYHGDPAVHHGIPGLLASYGYVVFPEDCLLGELLGPDGDCRAASDGEPVASDGEPAALDEDRRAAGGAAVPAANGQAAGDVAFDGAGLWEYPERVLAAAQAVAHDDALDMVQLYSFGCGLDAVTVDRARDVLEAAGKSLVALKIDEMVDLAPVRIRVRSMIAAQEGRIGKAAIARRDGVASRERAGASSDRPDEGCAAFAKEGRHGIC